MTKSLNPALKQAGAGGARPTQSEVTDFRCDLSAPMDVKCDLTICGSVPARLAVHKEQA
jgi:hypothetical protein